MHLAVDAVGHKQHVLIDLFFSPKGDNLTIQTRVETCFQ